MHPLTLGAGEIVVVVVTRVVGLPMPATLLITPPLAPPPCLPRPGNEKDIDVAPTPSSSGRDVGPDENDGPQFRFVLYECSLVDTTLGPS